VAIPVENLPPISLGAYGERCGTSASTEPFRPTGSSLKERLPKDNVLYGRKGVVELLKPCCTQIDTTLSISALKRLKKNVSSKSDRLAYSPSGCPVWIEVDLDQSDAERCFSSHAGKIALSSIGVVDSYGFLDAI
jgi:hypothetical protein